MTHDIQRAFERTGARDVRVTYFPELIVVVADDTSYVAFVIGDDDELEFRSGDGATVIVPID